MKIHIQDCRSRKFLCGVDTWVAGAASARSFSTSIDALRHCIDRGFSGVNIIVAFESNREPLVIPVDRERRAVDPAARAAA